jgi:thiol-disulfide isomerase/thioredoxin
MNKILFFSAPWCGTCQVLKPIAEKIAQDFSITFEIKDSVVDVEDFIKYNITTLPTVLLFSDKGEPLKLIGSLLPSQLRSNLKSFYNLEEINE